MQHFPPLMPTTSEKLKAGELFFMEFLDHKMVGLSATDKEQNDQQFLVLLGPTFPAQLPPGHMGKWQSVPVIGLGSDYRLSLPPDPAGWMVQPPPPDAVAMVLKGNEVYVRAKYKPFPGRSVWCLVKLSDGSVHDVPQAPIAFATRWSISLVENEATVHTVINCDAGA